MQREEQDKLFQEILEQYEGQKASASQEDFVELLREIQKIYAYIPEEVQEQISRRLDMKKSVIASIIRLYPSLTAIPFQHKITICLGAKCSSKDAYKIVKKIKTELKIEKNNMTSDKRFILTMKNCLKKCKSAPNLKIDDDFYSFVKEEDISEILKKYL